MAAAAALAVAVTLTGCGSSVAPPTGSGSDDSPTTQQQPIELDGTYVAVQFDGDREPLLVDADLSIAFDGAQLRAQAGCNSLMGDYRLTPGPDGVLLLEVSPMGGTEMGCDEQLMAQDEWVKEFLQAGPTIELSGANATSPERISLATDTVTITFTSQETLVPDASFHDTDWRLLALGDDDAAVSSPSSVTEVAGIRFAEDGTYRFTICNSGNGRYTIDGDSVDLIGGMQTTMACSGELGDLENEFVRLVGSDSVTWTIDGDRLRLEDGQGSGLLFVGA